MQSKEPRNPKPNKAMTMIVIISVFKTDQSADSHDEVARVLCDDVEKAVAVSSYEIRRGRDALTSIWPYPSNRRPSSWPPFAAGCTTIESQRLAR
jgi:hypothetical protein